MNEQKSINSETNKFQEYFHQVADRLKEPESSNYSSENRAYLAVMKTFFDILKNVKLSERVDKHEEYVNQGYFKIEDQEIPISFQDIKDSSFKKEPFITSTKEIMDHVHAMIPVKPKLIERRRNQYNAQGSDPLASHMIESVRQAFVSRVEEPAIKLVPGK